MDTLGNMRRTCWCGEVLTPGETVTVGGFVDTVRNKGGILFLVLRDRTGVVQLTFDDQTEPALFEKAASCRSEYVVMARGLVRERESVNDKIATGKVEIYVSELKILSKAQTPPFAVTAQTKVNEELRLRYRYLDLRREPLQRNLMLRHQIARCARDYFYEQGFLEIETPMMMKSTPEGARDYLVPSRVHHGEFYALPQSPQIYKQLLMVAGYDRYIQLARCFRDEDLRADRQPEFTQIDLEMSFVDVDDILEITEGFMKRLFHDVMGMELQTPLPRLTYTEAMNRFGTDKPDLRYGMEIVDLSDAVRDVDFAVFSDALAAGGSVRCVTAKDAAKALTRKEIDKLAEMVRGIGAKGLAYIRYAEETPACSFGKFLKPGQLDAILAAAGAEKGDAVFIVADRDSVTLPVLGALRVHLAKKLELIPEGEYRLLWITQFPFFEKDEETGEWVAMHHPFTMPLDECIPYLDTAPEKVFAKAYDLVLNGTELCSGSMRITDSELQEKMFRALGLSEEEIESKFGFLVEAYRYGAPPHGGLGIGLDRLTMTLAGAQSLRDVVAFPKLQNAREPMSGCPSPVDAENLQVLGIAVEEREDSDDGR